MTDGVPPAGGPPSQWQVPPGAVPPDPGAAPGADYLRANASRYTREALTAALARAGHPPEAIASAWAIVDAEDEARGVADRRGQVSAVIAVAYAGTWLVFTIGWILPNPDQLMSGLLLSLLLACFTGLPGLVAFAVARRSRRLGHAGTGMAVAFAAVPLVLLVALAGTCAAIVPPFSFSQ